jgi:hypothetical protein
VTFSDKRVADAVGKGFVAAWVNRGPGFRNVDFSTESWIFQGEMEAYPTKNICTFFLTPKGKVFHYVAGSYSPEVFLQVLETAAALRDVLFDGAMADKAGAAEAAAKIHLSRAEACEELIEKAKAAQSTPDGWKSMISAPKKPVGYRGLLHKHGPRCLNSLSQGWDYFAKLHRMWAEYHGLPRLEDVRYGYLYGNDFTEESEASARIERPDPTQLPKAIPPPPPKLARAAGKGGQDGLGLGLPGFNLGPLQGE